MRAFLWRKNYRKAVFTNVKMSVVLCAKRCTTFLLQAVIIFHSFGYSFNGLTISKEVKTFSISVNESSKQDNNTKAVRERLYEVLKSELEHRTERKMVKSNGDIQFICDIDEYKTEVRKDNKDKANAQLSVTATYCNKKDGTHDFEKNKMVESIEIMENKINEHGYNIEQLVKKFCDTLLDRTIAAW